MPFRILVLGGYGNFGRRICRALASDKQIWLGIAGRDLTRAREFASRLGSTPASCELVVIDHQGRNFSSQLGALRPDLVIHTSGPFQRQSYHVAEAAIDIGADYLDLADGADFVAGIAALDDSARRADVAVVSGASTLPAVSSAVVDRLSDEFKRIERVEIGIAPGQAVSRGQATLKAVLSYCGRPFSELTEGRRGDVFGWQGLRRVWYADLGWRWAARCDVPDLKLLPVRYPSLRSVRFDASLEFLLEHLGLWALAWLVRWGLVRDAAELAGPLMRAAQLLDRFGGDVGGMRLSVEGDRRDGGHGASTWHLTARNGDGPMIPCIPAIVLARRLARGERLESGARPCQGMMTLREFDDAARDFAISSRVVQS